MMQTIREVARELRPVIIVARVGVHTGADQTLRKRMPSSASPSIVGVAANE